VFVSDVLLVAAGIIVDVTLTHVVDTSYNWGQSMKPATEPFFAATQQTEMIVNMVILDYSTVL
jgi:hypothetical protein